MPALNTLHDIGKIKPSIFLHLPTLDWQRGCTIPTSEDGMILTAEQPGAGLATNLYRVEVSGWDDNKAFFVENSELEWTEQAGKQVKLNRGLTDRAVIFLRLLQPISSDRSRPVAYQAEMVARTEQGQRQFRLHPISSHLSHDANRG